MLFQPLKSTLAFIVLVGFSVLIGGCAKKSSGFDWVKPDDRRTGIIPDSVDLRLADAAERAANALEQLALVEDSKTKTTPTPPFLDAPPELLAPVTVTWIGPIEPLAARMAERAGYSFKVIGDSPPVAIVVNISSVSSPLIAVLRDMGLQTGSRADLVVNGRRRVIELRYAAVTGR